VLQKPDASRLQKEWDNNLESLLTFLETARYDTYRCGTGAASFPQEFLLDFLESTRYDTYRCGAGAA
jgi:GH24 family phage-related lysozyme (muramidase)